MIKSNESAYSLKINISTLSLSGGLILLVLFPFISQEMLFILLALFIGTQVSANRFTIPFGLLKISLPIFILLCFGVVMAGGNDLHAIIRDAWYVAQALLPLIFGYLLYTQSWQLGHIFLLLIAAGTVASLTHIFHFIFDPALLSRSLIEIRREVGTGNVAMPIAAALTVALWRYRFLRPPMPSFILPVAFGICLSALALSLSRTLWGIFLIWLVGIFGFLNLKSFKRLMTLILLIIIATSGVLFYGSTAESGSFLAKLAQSIQEITIANYTETQDINDFYRGFEAYKAFETYLAGNPIEYLLGRGFGTFVDLGIFMKLSGTEYRFIPIIHNGFLYVLLKTGALGLLCYIAFLSSFIKRGLQHTGDMRGEVSFAGSLMTANAITLFLSSLVVTGLFNLLAVFPLSILLGSCSAYLRQVNQPQRLPRES